MKTYFISLLMLASLSSFSAINGSNKNEKKATVSTISSVETTNAALSVKQLQDENMLLKQQLVEMSNQNEELKGMLSFQGLMHKMFTQLVAQKQTDEFEELKAQISYTALMSSMMLKLNQSK
jgi:hypothetical protein